MGQKAVCSLLVGNIFGCVFSFKICSITRDVTFFTFCRPEHSCQLYMLVFIWLLTTEIEEPEGQLVQSQLTKPGSVLVSLRFTSCGPHPQIKLVQDVT